MDKNNNIQLDYYKTLQQYLYETLEYVTIKMYESEDGDKNLNMRSFYHGEKSAIEQVLSKLHELKSIELQQQQWEEK